MDAESIDIQNGKNTSEREKEERCFLEKDCKSSLSSHPLAYNEKPSNV